MTNPTQLIEQLVGALEDAHTKLDHLQDRKAQKAALTAARAHLEQPTEPAPSTAGEWTGNTDIDAALIMLDRMDVGPEDDARVDAVSETLRKVAALLSAQALPVGVSESRCANCGKSASKAEGCISDYPEEGEWFCSVQCKDQHDELDCPHGTHDGYRHPPEAQRLIECENALRSLASWLGVGGYNSPTVDAKEFEEKIRDGVMHLYPTSAALPVGDLTDEQITLLWIKHRAGKFVDQWTFAEVARAILAAGRAQPVREPLDFEEWAKAQGIAEDLNFAKSHRPPPSRFYQHIHTNQVYMAWQYGITQGGKV